MDIEFVGIDLALNDVLAQAITAGDQHHVAESGLGIEGEDDAAGALVGPHHIHDRDRKRHFQVIESVLVAIDDGAVGEQGGEAAAAGLEHRLFAAYVDVTVMLAGKAGIGKILRGGRTAHRHRRMPAILLLQFAIGLGHLPADFVCTGGLIDQLARRLRPRGELLDGGFPQSLDKMAQPVPGLGLVQRVPIGLCRDAKSIGNIHALGGQRCIQFAKRRGLAADQRHVLHSQLAEPADISFIIHDRTVAWGLAGALIWRNARRFPAGPPGNLTPIKAIECAKSILKMNLCGIVMSDDAFRQDILEELASIRSQRGPYGVGETVWCGGCVRGNWRWSRRCGVKGSRIAEEVRWVNKKNRR